MPVGNGRPAFAIAKPFLRWAGGKRRIVNHLLRHLPCEQPTRYWEPFLGAGAMFFALAPHSAYLSDNNPQLMDCYRRVRDQPTLIHRYLQYHSTLTSERYYYSVRAKYNQSRDSFAQAGRFIYLNRTGFNGIFRVSVNGQYNVPYGHKEPPPLPSLADLKVASSLLRNVVLSTMPFEEALVSHQVGAGDLVYLDPPYPPLTRTANFTHYTPGRFSWLDHKRVAKFANELRDRGCNVMISNVDCDEVRRLYSDWYLHAVPVMRWIAANGRRWKTAELVITNYVPV